MHCPKCTSEFEKVTYGGIEVERCLNCNGLWFDMLEKEDLVAMEGAESIDIGSEQMGEQYNKIRDISCPNCHQDMIPMVDKDQFHIQYEACPACYGAFFDAGEFRDLKHHNVVERFLSMLETLRTHL